MTFKEIYQELKKHTEGTSNFLCIIVDEGHRAVMVNGMQLIRAEVELVRAIADIMMENGATSRDTFELIISTAVSFAQESGVNSADIEHFLDGVQMKLRTSKDTPSEQVQ